MGCGKRIEVTEGPYAGTRGEGPEYETVGGFGGNLLIDDLPAIAAINEACNDLGLDTISVSGAIAFATEAMERGLIPAEETGGLRLAWGDPEPVLALVNQIARREGLGALLADGSRAAAKSLGKAFTLVSDEIIPSVVTITSNKVIRPAQGFGGHDAHPLVAIV